LSPKILITIIYWGGACLIGLFILQTSEKFGQGVLINFMLGKYHRPKEENRIFMFMDLKSSTTYAEELGHIKYSQFIQDCFYDINDIITKYKGGIYQYVGDEVVVEWNIRQGIKDGNCINMFFAFDQLLQHKSEYYKSKYGVIPEFKAGLNLGIVTVAEVGVIKKELAYHGDVINTASRIQNKCNDLQKKVLISESTKSHLKDQPGLSFNFLGKFQLKGKMAPIGIYEAITV
jgi:adenylate cyclase